MIKAPAEIEGKPNPELNKFKYTDKPHFFIGTLDHYLPCPPLLKNIDINIELDLSKPSYVFHSADNSTVNKDISFEFEKCRLFVPELQLNDKLFLQLNDQLAKDVIRQFFVATELTTHSISTGSQNAIFDAISTGSDPQHLTLLIQEQSRFNGEFAKNCFKYSRVLNRPEAPLIIREVKVELNGEEVEGLACDKTNYSFKDQYFRFFYLTRQNFGTSACSLTYKDFTDHCLVNTFDLTAATASATEPPVLPVCKGGHIRVEVSFDKPSTTPCVLIAMVSKQASIMLEDSGKCTLATL